MPDPSVPGHLTELERSEEQIRYRLLVPSGDPLFVGHFPGQPILPGVGQLFFLARALSESLGCPTPWTGLQSVRFRKPIAPDTPCVLTLTGPDASGKVSFRIHGEADKEPIADGRFTIQASAVTPIATEEAAHG